MGKRLPAATTAIEVRWLSQHQAQIDDLTQKLAQATEAANHPGLSAEYLESQYGTCPNCTKAIDEFHEKAGFIKKPAAPTTPVVTQPKAEKMPWD